MSVAWGRAGAPCPAAVDGEHTWSEFPTGFGCGLCQAFVTAGMLRPVSALIERLPAMPVPTRWGCAR